MYDLSIVRRGEFWASPPDLPCFRVPDVWLTDTLNSYLDEIDRITAKMYFPTDGK